MDLNRSPHLEPALDTVRVALVYKDFVARGLSHAGLGVTSALTAKVLRSAGIWADVWACSSADDVQRRVEDTNARAAAQRQSPITHVIFAAPWIATETLAEFAGGHPEIVWVVACHSNVGFLAADCEAIRLMREAAALQPIVHNLRAAANCSRMADWASVAWKSRFVLLPNLYDLSEAAPPPRTPWSGGPLRIGMFGAARPLKNGVTGAAAAVLIAARLRVPVELYVSSGRDEGGSLHPVEEIVRGIPNLTLRPTGWLSWSEFRGFVGQMHVHLQPSYTESCNVTVQDAIAENVPSAVGPAIHWAPEHWKADVDDPTDVARVAQALLVDPNAAGDGRRALESYIRDGLSSWKSFFLSRTAEHQADWTADAVAWSRSA